RTPPRPCGARSCGPSARGPRGSRAAAARSAPGARPARRRAPPLPGRGRRVRRRLERGARVGHGLVARLVADLPALAVALRDAGDPVRHRLVAVVLLELRADRRGDLGLGRRLDVADELDHEPAVLLRVHRLEQRPGLRLREDGGVELGHVLPLLRRELAADRLGARVLRVALGELREVGAVRDLRADRLRERALPLADEDLLHLARRRVVALVRDVVRVDVLVRGLHVGGDLVEEALREELHADLLADRGVRVALLDERLPVALVAAAEVLLLDLVELRLHVLVGHPHAELRGLDLELRVLHEQRDDLRPEVGVLRRPRLRELLPLRGEALPLLLHQLVERRLRHVPVGDDGDVGRAELRASAPAAAGDERGQRNHDEKETELHEGRRFYAAWRAPSIASSSRSAPVSSSARSDTSRFADVYTAVSARSRSARSSPEPSTTGPTDERPERKTR